MTAETLDRWFAQLDETTIAREVQEYQAQVGALLNEIRKREDLLDLKHRWATGNSNATQATINGHNGNGSTNGNRTRQKPGQKRLAILHVMKSRPGGWTPKQVSDALRGNGLDPDGGTPVKNLLWHMAKIGPVVRLGNGQYELPAPSSNGAHTTAQGGLGL